MALNNAVRLHSKWEAWAGGERLYIHVYMPCINAIKVIQLYTLSVYLYVCLFEQEYTRELMSV